MTKPTVQQIRDSISDCELSPNDDVQLVAERLLKRSDLRGLTIAQELELCRTNLNKADDQLVLQEVENTASWICSNRSNITASDQAEFKTRFLEIESSVTAPSPVVAFVAQYVERRELTDDEVADRLGAVIALPSLTVDLETDIPLRNQYERLVENVDLDQLEPGTV